ncbi:hypothetical protein SRHO_G00043230 [Serrasalmus rhombeus]
MAHSESEAAVNVVNGNQVSYIGQDCEAIPEFLAVKYGSIARRLDLSFNRLRGVFRAHLVTEGEWKASKRLALEEEQEEEDEEALGYPHEHALHRQTGWAAFV